MKKLNKFFAILVALAMMATLCVSMAFAEPVTEDAGANAAALEDAKLVKYLKIDEGVTLPTKDFTFAFTAVGSDTIPVANHPAIDAQHTLAKIAVSDLGPSISNKDDGALVGYIPLASIIDESQYTTPGEYIYTVEETNTATTGDGWTFSDQDYTLRIYVKNGENGPEIDKVTVENNDQADPADPDAEPANPGTTGTKVDPTDSDPSDGEDPTDDDPSDDGNLPQNKITDLTVEGFTFINEYKLPDDDNPAIQNDYGAYYTTKKTTGDYGVKTTPFRMTITVTFPEAYAKGDKALNLYNKDGEKIAGAVLADTNAAANEGAGTLVWATTVDLADGDIAYFKNLPDGASVSVNENLTNAPNNGITNAQFYNQSTKSVTGNGTPVSVTDMFAADGTTAVPTKTKDAGALSQITAAPVVYDDDNAVLGEADAQTGKHATGNYVEVTNDNVYDPGNTGILMSNLPYIALALVAIGGLVAYVVVRRRQDDEA